MSAAQLQNRLIRLLLVLLGMSSASGQRTAAGLLGSPGRAEWPGADLGEGGLRGSGHGRACSLGGARATKGRSDRPGPGHTPAIPPQYPLRAQARPHSPESPGSRGGVRPGAGAREDHARRRDPRRRRTARQRARIPSGGDLLRRSGRVTSGGMDRRSGQPASGPRGGHLGRSRGGSPSRFGEISGGRSGGLAASLGPSSARSLQS
jgi:hypothetical protein